MGSELLRDLSLLTWRRKRTTLGRSISFERIEGLSSAYTSFKNLQDSGKRRCFNVRDAARSWASEGLRTASRGTETLHGTSDLGDELGELADEIRVQLRSRGFDGER